MAVRFVCVDHDTPLLMPPDLREWVPEDHLVHFIMDAIGLIDLRAAKINERGTGSRQYPPALMLGLLIYSYATGTFSSRQIERSTYENVAVRLLCADLHPDHDSICTFRRANGTLLKSSFEQVLAMAAQMRVLRVGQVTLAIDGTKILANASKHSAVSHGRALAQIELLERQVAELLSKAEAADSAPLEDGLTLPEEITRRQDRLEQLRAASAVIKERAKERYQQELSQFQSKEQERVERAKKTGKKPGGRPPQPPQKGPRDKDQFNFTDPESRIMKTPDGFGQSYNAQAAVEIESRLLVGVNVSDAPNDKGQLKPTLEAVSPVIESVEAVLVDSGYYSAAAVAGVEQPSEGKAAPMIYAATGRKSHGRTVQEPEQRVDPPSPGPEACTKERMKHRLETKQGRELYALRKQTIEPIFGIIKETLGFRRFSLRGLKNVRTEWTLVTLAYNLKRLFHIGSAPLAAEKGPEPRLLGAFKTVLKRFLARTLGQSPPNTFRASRKSLPLPNPPYPHSLDLVS